MEKHPHFAKGATYVQDKEKYKSLSEELSKELNSQGPPIRSKPADWLKVIFKSI